MSVSTRMARSRAPSIAAVLISSSSPKSMNASTCARHLMSSSRHLSYIAVEAPDSCWSAMRRCIEVSAAIKSASPSASSKPSFPLSRARLVNSPGSAGRKAVCLCACGGGGGGGGLLSFGHTLHSQAAPLSLALAISNTCSRSLALYLSILDSLSTPISPALKGIRAPLLLLPAIRARVTRRCLRP